MTLTEQNRSTAARLVGVDAARGAALIGMMAVHISPRLGADGGVTTEYLIASGRSAALFAVLAGVGLALASGGANPPRGAAWKGVAAGTAARAGVLLLVGFLLGEFDSGVAVILVYYALLFVVGIPFLSLGPRVLLPLAVVWAAVTPVISQFARLGDTWQPPGNPILASLADPVGLATDLFLTGYYPVLQWTAYLLLGLGLGRLDLHRLSSQAAVLVGGAALGATAWATSWLLLENGGLAELRAAGTGSHPMADGTLDAALQPGLYGTTPTTSWWWL
ncbi:MAG: heparan-alpha-glucosaminide N-acetyltransferase domain-containing protein, partial [Actinomycetota bacterium]